MSIHADSCRCCTDMRYIQPAKLIGFTEWDPEDELCQMIEKAKDDKKFIAMIYEDGDTYYGVVDKCPWCGYEFTEDDYDSYYP